MFWKKKKTEQPSSYTPTSDALVDMLDAYAQIGVRAHTDADRSRVLGLDLTSRNESIAWRKLGFTLATTPTGEPIGEEDPRGLGILYLDWEFIDEAEDYVTLTAALAHLVADYVEINSISAALGDSGGRIEFTAQGVNQSIEVELMDDWVDPALLIGINALLAEAGEHRLFFLEPADPSDGGQDTLIVVTTPVRAREFATKSGLVVESPEK